ncbi:MAG: hypothetical protein JW797_17090 [Bradymonadales bacterium]|nr:hypothetical protein [Bradymonadales bacterium]
MTKSRYPALVRFLWASAAGCLLAQAYLHHGLWAWPAAVALAMAVGPGLQGRAPRRSVVVACVLCFTWFGLHGWGFLYYGRLLFLVSVLYNGLAGLLVGLLLLPGRSPCRYPVLRFALAFTAVEYARQLGPFGFPLAVGATQVHLPWRLAMAVVGSFGLSGLIAAVGFATAELLRTFARQGRNRPFRQALALAGWVAAMAAVTLVGGWQPGLERQGDPQIAAIVQGGIPTWLYQASQGSQDAALQVESTYFGLSAQALQTDADLVVLPEAALHRPIPVDGDRAGEPLFGLPASGRQYGLVAVVTGGYREVWTGPRGSDLALYNSALLFAGDDPRRILDAVDKRLLVPVAEAEFSRGQTDPFLSWEDLELGVLICWESLYPRLARDLARRASILLVLTNDAGFQMAPVTLTHARQAWSRAVECGRPLVRAAQAGISLLVDHRGRLLDQMDLFESGLLSAAIQPMRGWTWFTLFGYLIGPLSLGGSLVWAIASPLRRFLANHRASSRTA